MTVVVRSLDLFRIHPGWAWQTEWQNAAESALECFRALEGAQRCFKVLQSAPEYPIGLTTVFLLSAKISKCVSVSLIDISKRISQNWQAVT